MLPVKKIVLFKHGVGYFEREGQVENDAAIELQFKASEMNDVLKSLTAVDLDGGSIASISYESAKPTSRLLEEVAISLPEDGVLTSLIGQIKGAPVSFVLGGRMREGEIIGVEAFQKQAGDEPVMEHRLVILAEGKQVQSFNLLELESLEIRDEKVRSDLKYLLETLLSSKRADLKNMQIFAKGSGARRIHVSYIIETPVWKTSYRVLLQDDAKMLLQGWALIDNTQDQDWNDVQVSLVAGLPVSFVHDLYNMRYQRRPVIEVEEEAPYAPPELEEAQEYEAMPAAPVVRMAAMTAAPAPVRAKAVRAGMQQKVEVVREAREAGEMYEYSIRNPVTVRRGQSALVPVLSETIDGARVSVFNESVREKNPMAAMELKNTIGITLEGGPVTVFEEGGYVGEAMLRTLTPGATQLLPFAVELGCVITRDHRSQTRPVHQVVISNGTVYLYFSLLHTTVYSIHNKSDRKLDLILEHPFRKGWELADTPEPFEKTDNYYRFRLEAKPPRWSGDFTVTEKGLEHRSISVAGITGEQIRELVSSNYLDAKSQHALKEIVELQNRVADLDRNLKVMNQTLQGIFKNQERLRQNLQSLGARQEETELRQKYVKQLSEEEDKVQELTRKVESLQQEKMSIEQIRADKIQKMSYTATLA